MPDAIPLIEPVLLGVSLAMDAFAVSIATGAVERKNLDWEKIFLMALSFGVFQSVMPTAGWAGGQLFASFVRAFGKWIASLLLVFLGGKMIYEAFPHGNNEEKKDDRHFSYTRLLVLSIATSIDALLVGFGYACLGRTNICADVLIIGFVTFLISAAGGYCGRFFGNFFGNKCEVFGGLILIAIAVKIMFFG